MKQNQLNCAIFWLPWISSLVFLGSELVLVMISHITLVKIFLGSFTSALSFIAFMSGAIMLGCAVDLILTHNLKNYFESLSASFKLHRQLKINPSYSDYKDKSQRLNYNQRSYNFCVAESYIWINARCIKTVIAIPENIEASKLLSDKLSDLRTALTAEYKTCLFGDYIQEGNYKILEGNWQRVNKNR